MSLLKKHEVIVSKVFKSTCHSRLSFNKLYNIEIKVLCASKLYNKHAHIYPRNNKLMLFGLRKKNTNLIILSFFRQYTSKRIFWDAGGILRHIRNNSSSTDNFFSVMKLDLGFQQ